MGMKKVLAALLSLTLVMGAAGCGQTQTGTSGTEAPESTAAASEAGTAAEEAGSEAAQSSDGELITVKILGINGKATGDGGQTMTMKDWYTDGKSQRWQKVVDDLAARGVQLDLELIEQDQYTTTIQTMVASGEFSNYDFVNVTGLDQKTLISLMRQGQIQQLDDAIEQYSAGDLTAFMETEAGQYWRNHMKYEDGNLYWFNSISTYTYDGGPGNSALGASIRQDWLDAIGAEIPQTTEELFDVLTQFQEQDVNQSGSADEVMWLNYSNFNTDVAQWFGLGADVTFVNLQDNNTVTSPWYQENVKDYIAYMNRLYEAGLLKMNDSQTSSYMTENRVAVISDWATQTWNEPTVVVPEGAEYPWYVGFRAEAVEGQTPLWRGGNQYMMGTSYFVVPAESQNIEGVIKMLDYFCSDEGVEVTEWGIEGVNYTEDEEGNMTQDLDPTFENVDAACNCAFWANNLIPRFELGRDIAQAMSRTTNFGIDHGVANNPAGKANFIEACMKDQDHRTPHDKGDLAFPTLEEISATSDLTTDLTTYSQELLSKLITGERSMDDWDTYIQDLKDLGLDEIIAAEQARADRAMGAE